MPHLYLAARPQPMPDYRLHAVSRALAHLDLPVEDGMFDDLLHALAQIDPPRRARFEPPSRAAA